VNTEPWADRDRDAFVRNSLTRSAPIREPSAGKTAGGIPGRTCPKGRTEMTSDFSNTLSVGTSRRREPRPYAQGLRVLAAAAALIACSAAQAFEFDVPGWGGQDIEAVLNTTITAGASWRMEDRADDLVGKSNLDPQVCGRENGRLRWQSCQGLFRTQVFPAERLVSAPGQFSMNADDGNLNYDRYDLVQGPLKTTMDLTLTRGDWGVFIKGLYFYDFVNNHFTEYHPNRVTRENLDQVGDVSTVGTELLALPVPLTGATVRNDSRPCPASRNPGGGPCGLVYGAGGVVRNRRSDRETLRQIGAGAQLLDALVYGELPLYGDHVATIKLGRQTVNWGESTLLFFDSINQASPVDANNLFRTGFQTEEVMRPINMLFASASLVDNLSLEGFYQLEWQPTIAPAPGSFYSSADIGSNNAIDFLTLGFGSSPEDPDRVARLSDNPFSGVTNTSLGLVRLRDREPDAQGQFGVALKYYAESIGNGTELGLYFMNYHSRLPFVSMYSVDEACSKHARNALEFLAACPDLPLLHAATQPNDPEGATDSAMDFDGLQVRVEYPEDIRMFGISFNTSVSDFTLQGEVAYRPDAPMQVDPADLSFAAYGPAATNCHLPGEGCIGSGLSPGIGKLPDGSTGTAYPSSDFIVDAQGTPGSFRDTFDLMYGHAAGVGRYFPSFVIPYRGMVLGENPPHSYIRGWEYFDSYQFNLGGTYVTGATDLASRLIFADQIILLYEAGATWVPDLPPLDQLQLAAPGNYLHASAGADGSGADRSRQACSTNLACSYGPDGIRFNPHQADLDLYPDKLSWGYDLIAMISYESVLPGISLRPTLIWKHDVQGTAPGMASNFVAGRRMADVNLEIRYKSQFSLNLGYGLIAGGGAANLLRDRDTARAFIKYQF